MPTRIKPLDLASPDEVEQGAHGVRRANDGIWGYRPELHGAYMSFYTAQIRECTLSPRLCELVRLRIAFHNQCRSCMAFRHQPGVVSEDDVCSLERPEQATDLSDAERAALHFADLFATDHLAIDELVYDRLREYFTEGELVELGVWCAVCVGFGRMMATWHMVDDLPDSYKARLDQVETPWGHDDAYRAPAPQDVGAPG